MLCLSGGLFVFFSSQVFVDWYQNYYSRCYNCQYDLCIETAMTLYQKVAKVYPQQYNTGDVEFI